MRFLSILLIFGLATAVMAAEEKKKEQKPAPAQMEESTQQEPAPVNQGVGSPLLTVGEGPAQGISEQQGATAYSSTPPQALTSRPGDLPFGTPWGMPNSEQPQSTDQSPQPTSTLSTDELLNMNANDLGDPNQRSTILNSLAAAIKKWEQFSSRGGVGSGVLGQLKEMRASLTKKDEEEDTKVTELSTEPLPTESAPPTETTTSEDEQRPDDSTPQEETTTPEPPKESDTEEKKGRDTHPPACNFSIGRTDSGDANNRVTIKDINFIDNKDPKTNMASGVTKIRFSNDGKSWQEFSLSQDEILWTAQPDENGAVTIHMQACDKDGNWGNGASETFVRTIQLGQ